MAFTYANSPVLSKLQINGNTYYLKDADLRAVVDAFKGAVAYDVDTTFNAEGENLATEKAIAAWLEGQIAGLSGAMHFAGVKTEEEFADGALAGAAGDVIIVGTTEYVHDGSKWVEIGDEGVYATKEGVANAYVAKTATIAGIDLADNITVAELQAALQLKALAYKDSASGTITTIDSIDNISAAKAGEYSVAASTVSVPQTFSAMDVTPAGSVELTAGTAAAVSYDKVTGVTVSAVEAGDGQTANYTPAGTVALPSITITHTPTKADVATVTNAGTAYSITDGAVSQGEASTGKFATNGVVASVSQDDAEMLVFSTASTSDAITAQGAISYTAPVLSGALPTFGTANVVSGLADAAASYNGEASFTGVGAVIGATATTTATAASVTQPTFTAEFTGTSKSVTPEVATSASAAGTDGKVTVASEEIEIKANSSAKTVTVQ